MSARFASRAAWRVILALGSIATAGGQHTAMAACSLARGTIHTVVKVLDGETLQLDDASRIRLANILAPRAVDAGFAPGRFEAEQAAIAALDALAVGRAIELRFDATRKDRYGMVRAHVRLKSSDGTDIWLQQRLVAAGHARVDARLGERACVDDLREAEATARAAGLGLWRESLYRVRPAVPARDLSPYRGTLQTITGVVRSSETARDLIRLVLGGDRRRDATISFRANDRDILGALGGDVRALVGRTVEARGWIEQRRGSFGAPDVDVSLAGFVRLVPP